MSKLFKNISVWLKNSSVINCLNFFLNTTIVIYSATLLFFIGGYIKYIISKNGLDFNGWEDPVKDIFHLVEIIFISPLPLLALAAFKKYLNSTAFAKNKTDDAARFARLVMSILEMDITKSNFISVILTTFFITIVEKIIRTNKNSDQVSYEYTNNELILFAIISISMILLFFFYKKIKLSIHEFVEQANKANEIAKSTPKEKLEQLSKSVIDDTNDMRLDMEEEIKEAMEKLNELNQEISKKESHLNNINSEIAKKEVK